MEKENVWEEGERTRRKGGDREGDEVEETEDEKWMNLGN